MNENKNKCPDCGGKLRHECKNFGSWRRCEQCGRIYAPDAGIAADELSRDERLTQLGERLAELERVAKEAPRQ